jgi:hypothetical protein
MILAILPEDPAIAAAAGAGSSLLDIPAGNPVFQGVARLLESASILPECGRSP